MAPGLDSVKRGPATPLVPALYVRRANEETGVYAPFEDVAGVDEVEAICRVPGIDGVAVGAYDLAASMGHPGEPWREDVQAVVERVLQTCRRSRMPFGTVPRDRADLGRQIEAPFLTRLANRATSSSRGVDASSSL